MKKPVTIAEAKKRWKTWTRGVLSKEALEAEKDGTQWVTLNNIIHVILGFDFAFHVYWPEHFVPTRKRDFCFRVGFASKEAMKEAHDQKLMNPRTPGWFERGRRN